MTAAALIGGVLLALAAPADGGAEPDAAPVDGGVEPDAARPQQIPPGASPGPKAAPPGLVPATTVEPASKTPAGTAAGSAGGWADTAGAKPGAAWQLPHYDEGFVLVSTPEAGGLPFRLRLNHVSQFKYTNTLAVNKTFTDHLGREREVLRRNDIQLTRDVFYFSGFAFDRRLDFNIIVYTSTADLSASAAGYVGFVFHKAFALRAGFFSLPSLRPMTGTYPYFAGTDRSLATNYMRPGFTQGVWANGELFPGFNYIAMAGNSLNTLNLAASRIDNNFAYAATIWYDRNKFGHPWNDYERHESGALRIGTSFTFAREDRLSDLSTGVPENNSTFMSDGVLLFETGALAPDITVTLANFYLWAIDFGVKYRGFAFNVELSQRWLNNFRADGPLPISRMYDWGADMSLGYFVLTRRLETYVRSSFISGPFRTGVEGAVGLHFYPFNTRGVWLSAEAIAIQNSPYGSVLYTYSAGQTGVLFPAQFLLRF
jgi:hypothetical protein